MQYKRNRALLSVTALLLVLGMLFAFSGCSAVITNPVVAKVGDVDILYSQFYNLYSTYESYANYGLITFTTDDTKGELRAKVFDALISSAIPIAEAHKQGLKLDAAEEETLAATVQEQLDKAIAEYADEVDENITDEAAIKEAEMLLFVEYLKGYKLTYDEYKALLEEQERDNMLADKLKAQVTVGATATEEEAKTWYDEKLAAQLADYATTPANYYNDSQNAQYSGDVGPLVAPEGYFYVKHILVKNAEEGSDKDVDAIVAEIQAKIDAGEDFESLIEVYNEDEGMKQEANANGYLLSEANASQYYAEFSAAALALDVGEVSAPVTSSAGVHIIKKMGPVDTTPVTFDSIKDKIVEQLIGDRKDELYAAAFETWRSGLKIVQYDNRVKTVGANS